MSDRARDPLLPESLVRELERDSAPVRPLLRPEIRAAVSLLVAAAAGSLFLILFGMREDFGTLPRLPLLTLLLVRVAAGHALIFLAMKEAIPAAGWQDRTRAIALSLAIAAVVVLPELFARAIGFEAPRDIHPSSCFPLILLVGLPTYIFVFTLLSRAYPLRATLTGLGAGMGTGLLAEAALFVACGNAAPLHGLIVHGSATLAFGAAGAIGGWLITRARHAR